ncbi:hypothetical protein KIN20_028873 [Parelaphostrongylus tenuis]|uniref:Uncharacterized protein n=1 Tax=Parelaphostrongylus tenuis TaxID=148309 RepID=A0AAD5R1U9_PARTN|nr:hypothetical protein KIN20_028873 [Parelaphostrongylus tenuis]
MAKCIISLSWEDTVVDNIDEEYDRLVEYLRVNSMKAEITDVTKRSLSSQTLGSVLANKLLPANSAQITMK